MNHKKPHPLQKSVAFIAALALLATSALAGNVTMTTSDGFGASSFNSAGHWDSGQAPTAGNNYFSAAYVIRTPNSGSTNLTFAGDSLTLNSGGALYCKLQPEWVTINILTNSGKVNNAQGGTFTLLGNMFAPTNTGGGSIDTGSGNSSATDNRTINMMMNLNGSGTLTNWTSDNNWVTTWSAAQGTVLLGGNNVNYTGQLLVYRNTALVVGSQANLGGNPDVFTPGQLTLNVGTLRPNASFAMTNSNSGITIGSGGGNFDIAAGLFLTNAEALVGPGTLALTNAGTLVHLGSAANFTGNLLINNGSFILGAGASLAGTNTITINSAATFDATAAGLALSSGQTLAGNGTVTGSVTANSGSRISPGGTGNAATLTVSGDLNLNDGAGIVVDFLSTNDVVAVNGNLTPTGVTSIELVNVPAIGTYPLVTVSGTLGGSTNNFHVNALTTRNRSYAVLYDTVSTPNRVLLVVSSSGTAANLVWQGDTVAGLNNAWDIAGTSNWLNGAVSDVYYDGDTNNFTDVGATNQPVLNVTVNPGAVYFVSSSNYTLVGSGAIAGQTAVNKGGTGTVTLSTTNTYSGGTRITNGVLKLGAVQALGLPTGGTPLASVLNTGTLDLNGAALDASYTTTVQVNGDGFSGSGQGAIDNTVGGLTSGGGDIGIASLTLAGNSTVSATANWQIGNTGTGITGNGFVLTKTGNGYLYLKHAAANPLGGFVLAGGAVLFWDHADALGATTPITLTNGGSIDTWNPATYFQGLTFNNPLTVSDPVNGGMIFNTRVPYNHPPSDIYNGPVTLNGTLVFSNNAFVAANQYNNNQNTFGKITMNGNISGPGGIVAIGGTAHLLGTGSPEFYGGNLVTLNGNNSYSGPTLVTNLIQLLITTANQSGGSYDVVDYATVDIAVAAGKPTIPMSSLLLDQSLLGPGNIGFTRLAGMPSVPVVYATNLIINAGVILPPVAGYSIGQFPLIKYDGTIGGNGFGGLQLGSLPAGVAATLVNNTGNHTIDLNVTAAGIQWTGASSTNWDMSTVNWFNPVSASTGTYADGQTVVFGDPATNYTVNLSQIVQPGGLTINSTNTYTFTASVGGGISGSGALIKNGSGTLIIACTNNTFTGGTYINGGTLMLSDSNFGYPYGGGALNNNLGNVTINGGTLDINAIQVPNYQSYGPDGYNVFLSGSGVNGAGALVNNNTNANDSADPGYVTLTGNATVGGPGDINIRMGVSPQLSSQSSAYTLTKIGNGQFRIRYLATVSTNFGPINILQGIVSYESSSTLGLGDPGKNIYVGSGAGFAWGTLSAKCPRPLICSNNATLYGYNVASNIFTGPITLDSGNVNLNANFYHGMIFSNVISGAGGVTVQYQSYVTFAAANTYSGDTVVVNSGSAPGSLLRLAGNGSIANSAHITLLGVTASQAYPGALDASTRADGTLTLSGQTLRGDNGSYVKGNVVAGAGGATITPGGLGNVQSMTFSNNLTLSANSTVVMDVSLDSGITNDLIKVVGANAYAGTLQINNSGVAALTNGASFKLFSNGSYSGNFTTLSGTPGPGLGWSFNPATGVATVITVFVPKPVFTGIQVTGTTLSITATNGSSGGQFVLYSSTNIALPLAQWTPVLTNSFDVNGNLNLSTNIINPAIPDQYYLLQ